MSKVILVTGSSSGMGREACMQLAEKGYRVFAAMRKLDNKKDLVVEGHKRGVNLEYIQLDVTDDNSVKIAVEQIIDKAGNIDVLINNAGYGLMGALETITIDEAKKQYDINFFGTVRCIQAVLPYMRKQGRGIIINISSVAAITGNPLSSIYASSKFAVEGLTESLVDELSPFGIRVCLIQPGLVLTHFAENKKFGTRIESENNPYQHMMDEKNRFFNELRKTSAAQNVKDAVLAYIEAVEDTSSCLRFQTSLRIKELAKKRYHNPYKCVSMN